MTALELVVLGGLLGAAGQVVRVIVGTKKVADRAAANKTSYAEEFDASQLAVSLIIGFAAGVAAALSLSDATMAELNRRSMVGVMAAGYAGTDFIEGFSRKYSLAVNAAQPASKMTKS